MSSSTRGSSAGPSGRGRGRGRRTTVDSDEEDSPSAALRTPAPPSSSSLRSATPYGTLGSGPVAGPSNAAAQLFRKNDYTGAAANGTGKAPVKMKFTPKLDKANKAPVVKKEPIEPSIKAPAGRGRGRGRGMRPEMTASGAFSAGPAAQPKSRASYGQSGGGGSGGGGGPGGGGGSSGGGGWGGGGSSSKAEPGTGQAPDVIDLSDDDDPAFASADEDDDVDTMYDADGHETAPARRNVKAEAGQASIQLDRIHLETKGSTLTPLNLPRPPRSNEDKRKEQERAEAVKRLEEAKRTGLPVEAPRPPPPILSHEEQLRKNMAAEFLETSEHQKMHVFQFPRTFPTFRKSSADADAAKQEDVKPNLAELKPPKEPQNAAEYLAGGWEGFGKRATRKGRPMLGGPGKPSGQIGKIQVLEGGKVRMILGHGDEPDLVYDPQFLQELAVIAPKDTNLFTPPVKSEDMNGMDVDIKPATMARPSMLIMGQVERKYIVRPDINILLEQMAATDEDRRREAEQAKVDEETKAKELKERQMQDAVQKKLEAKAAGKSEAKPSTSKAKASTSAGTGKKKG